MSTIISTNISMGSISTVISTTVSTDVSPGSLLCASLLSGVLWISLWRAFPWHFHRGFSKGVSLWPSLPPRVYWVHHYLCLYCNSMTTRQVTLDPMNDCFIFHTWGNFHTCITESSNSRTEIVWFFFVTTPFFFWCTSPWGVMSKILSIKYSH